MRHCYLNILELVLADCVDAVAFQDAFCLRNVGAADNHTGAVGFAAGKTVHIFYVATVGCEQL